MFLSLRKEKTDSLLIGLFALCFAMGSALWLGQDASWDLRNYHFYNPYAWLQNRAGVDVAPAQLQSFLHPFADLPHYLMVKAGFPSWLIGCALALPVAISLYFLARLSQAANEHAKSICGVLAILLIAGTGASGFPVIGSTMSEWHVTALFMAALWITFKENRPPSFSTCLLAGLLGGFAVGLKLTGSVFAVALGAMYLTLPGLFTQKLQQTIYLAIGGLVGFAIAFAPWGLTLWSRYHNPLFPFFNQWFQSPWAEFSSYAGTQHAVKSLWDLITLPWQLMNSTAPLVAEFRLQDWRLGLGFPALALLAFSPFMAIEERQRYWRPLFVFCIVSYVIWAQLYGIYRYVGVLEVLMALAIIKASLSVFKKQQMLVVVLTTVLVLTPTIWPYWGRLPHGSPAVLANMPKLPNKAMVVFATLEPVAYLVPNLPPEVPVVSLVNNFMQPHIETMQLQKLANQKIMEHDGSLWLLTQKGFEQEKYYNGKPIASLLKEFGLSVRTENCLPIQSEFSNSMALCQMFIQGQALPAIKKDPI